MIWESVTEISRAPDWDFRLPWQKKLNSTDDTP